MTAKLFLILIATASLHAQSLLVIVSGSGTGGGGGGGGGGSCASGYLHCRSLTIDHTQVSSTQTNFPVMCWNACTLGSSRVQNANCYDVIFSSDSAGTALIPWEIESCNQSTGAIVAKFKVASLSSSSDVTVYVHYDNSGISTAQNTGSYAPAQIYDSNFKAVWSLGNGSSLSGADSSGNSSTLSTITGTVAAATGKLDGGASISSGNYAGALAGFGSAQSAVTVSGWVNIDSSYSDSSFGLPIYNTGNLLYLFINTSRQAGIGLSVGGTAIAQSSVTVLTKGVWYYIVGTYDGTNTDIYINGVRDDNGARNQGTGNLSTFSTIQLGGNNFIGLVDEFRVSNTARSADWNAIEYNNEKASSTFLTVGSEI